VKDYLLNVGADERIILKISGDVSANRIKVS
jgi:hypothetical protein